MVTKVWNFVNNFRQAECAFDNLKMYTFGQPPLAEYTGDSDIQQSGGWGQCCSACTSRSDCTAWTYGAAGNQSSNGAAQPLVCRLYAAAPTGAASCNGTCVSGRRGQFEQWTTLPQHFKNHGYLTLGTGKLFHDGGGGCSIPSSNCGPGEV